MGMPLALGGGHLPILPLRPHLPPSSLQLHPSSVGGSRPEREASVGRLVGVKEFKYDRRGGGVFERLEVES